VAVPVGLDRDHLHQSTAVGQHFSASTFPEFVATYAYLLKQQSNTAHE
jgi:hypothetical protein